MLPKVFKVEWKGESPSVLYVIGQERNANAYASSNPEITELVWDDKWAFKLEVFVRFRMIPAQLNVDTIEKLWEQYDKWMSRHEQWEGKRNGAKEKFFHDKDHFMTSAGLYAWVMEYYRHHKIGSDKAAYAIAKALYVPSGCDHMADTNSLWDYVDGDQTVDLLRDAARDYIADRVTGETGQQLPIEDAIQFAQML